MNLSGWGKEGKTGSEELIDDASGTVANARVSHLNQHKSLIIQHPVAESGKTASPQANKAPIRYHLPCPSHPPNPPRKKPPEPIGSGGL